MPARCNGLFNAHGDGLPALHTRLTGKQADGHIFLVSHGLRLGGDCAAKNHQKGEGEKNKKAGGHGVQTHLFEKAFHTNHT
jgi:hypothetical protein